MEGVRTSQPSRAMEIPTGNILDGPIPQTTGASFFKRVTALLSSRPVIKRSELSVQAPPDLYHEQSVQPVKFESKQLGTSKNLPSDVAIPRLVHPNESTSYYSFPAYRGPGSGGSATILSSLCSNKQDMDTLYSGAETAVSGLGTAAKRLSASVLGRLSPRSTPPPQNTPRPASGPVFSTVTLAEDAQMSGFGCARPVTRGSKIAPGSREGRSSVPGSLQSLTFEKIQGRSSPSYIIITPGPKVLQQTLDTCGESSVVLTYPNICQNTPPSNDIYSPHRLISAQKPSLLTQATTVTATSQGQLHYPDFRDGLGSENASPKLHQHLDGGHGRQMPTRSPSRPVDWSMTTTNSFLRQPGGPRAIVRQDVSTAIDSETEPSSCTETDYYAGSSSSSSGTIVGKMSEERWFTEGRAWAGKVTKHDLDKTLSMSKSDHGTQQLVNPLEGTKMKQHGDQQHFKSSTVRVGSAHSPDPFRNGGGRIEYGGPSRALGYGNSSPTFHGKGKQVCRDQPSDPCIRGGADSGSGSGSYTIPTPPLRYQNIPRLRGGAGEHAEGSQSQQRSDAQKRVPSLLWTLAGGRGKAPSVENYRKTYWEKPTGALNKLMRGGSRSSEKLKEGKEGGVKGSGGDSSSTSGK